MASITRYSSVGSLSGALLMPVFLYLWGKPPEFIVWGIFAAALVFWRHKGNIQRLIQGKELKMGQKGA
jgi:glycerol-3-phosphate acyltransferase PlsY